VIDVEVAFIWAPDQRPSLSPSIVGETQTATRPTPHSSNFRFVHLLMPNDIKAVQRQTAQYDLFNRLHSIASDSTFVRTIAETYGRFGVVANQRCGTWYCDASSTYAYFKSTDGHTGNWSFNLRRSNLSFASYAESKGGVILVDSTRRGKRMPDALSKTVPIWCAVINRAIAKRRKLEQMEWSSELYTPPNVVPGSEKAQIEETLDAWAEALEVSQAGVGADLRRPLSLYPI
jgi:tRNA A64-2'-O-ribosylphosphate transferase